MNNPFLETSKSVANQFLQNIVFIDDKAFKKDDSSNHHFDALQISKVFAKSQKVCAVYRPDRFEDIDDLAELAKKADVTVLDWQINIEPEKAANEEEDAEDDDPRGPHTKRIIRSILTDPLTGQGSLKLIVIYTGETDLNYITDEIYDDLIGNKIFNLKKGECQVYTDNIKILVIAKSNLEGKAESKYKHAPEFKKFVVEYEELPEFILTSFAEMTTGLLTNFVLNSFTVLRRNTYRLINLFSKDLDSAFLTHKSLLPNPEDAKDQLIELVGAEIKSMLKGNDVASLITSEHISHFIDLYIKEPLEFKISEQDKYRTIKFPDKLSLDNLKKIVEYGVNSFFIKPSDPFEEQQLFEKNCHKTLISCFSKNKEVIEHSNIRFASLTTLKSFYNQGYLPILTQGTILLEDKKKGSFWLCIQPKCDSVRIHTKKRDFLLLRLIEVEPDSNFDVVIVPKTFLKIDYSIYNSKLVAFVKTNKSNVTPIPSEDGKLKFQRGDNQKMIWIGELKSDFAQSISNTFAGRISRVGMDHSEWLRRS